MDAATLIARAVEDCPEASRAAFLRELLAHAAAGLVITEGHVETAEAVYRLADAVVARGADAGPAYCPPVSDPPRRRWRLPFGKR